MEHCAAYFLQFADRGPTPVFNADFFLWRYGHTRLSFETQCRLGYRHVCKYYRFNRFRWIVADDFHAFLAEIEVVAEPGYGYAFFWQLVRQWGWRRGFAVPWTYPHCYETPELVCRDAAGFPRNLTEGAAYRLVSRKVLDGKLRVRDDRNRLSWFPLSCFDTAPLELATRRWVDPNPAVPDFWQTETRPFAIQEP